MKVAIALLLVLVAVVCVAEQTSALRKKRQKKIVFRRPKPCQSEADCNPRQCCQRAIITIEEGGQNFAKKGKCVNVKKVADSARLGVTVLDNAACEDDFAANLTAAASTPTPGDFLFICPAQSLTSTSGVTRAAGEKKKNKAKKNKAKKSKAMKMKFWVWADDVLPDISAPDVAIGRRIQPIAPEEPTEMEVETTEEAVAGPDVGGAQ